MAAVNVAKKEEEDPVSFLLNPDS